VKKQRRVYRPVPHRCKNCGELCYGRGVPPAEVVPTPAPVTGAVWISVTQGAFVLVDESDVRCVMEFNWRLASQGKRYAMAYVAGHHVLMHRFLMSLELGDGLEVDHINGDGLDNRRSNLRVCTAKQNRGNQKKHHDNKSGYKGVIRMRDATRNRPWRAQTNWDHQMCVLGYFHTAEEAASVYDRAARVYYGAAFARTNFSEQWSG